MNDDSCKVPREDLDDGFNPCRKQVVENGELSQYAHMYDVMSERYDREGDTGYLDSVKRDRISQSTPSQSTGGGKIYSQDTNGVEGFISTSGTLEPTTNAEIPSSKAVAGYVADYAPIPLPISKGGTGGNTPYVTDDLGSSAVFVMHDAPNDRYDAAPMSALTGYLDTQYLPVNSIPIPPNSDLNEYKTTGKYAVEGNSAVPSIINAPNNLTKAFNIYVFPVLTENYYIGQQLTTYDGSGTYYRFYSSITEQWYPWTQLYPNSAPAVPDKFSYAVAPFPAGDWEGEMTVNVVPVFSVTIGTVEYIIARVYGAKKFNYTGTADNISLFSSIHIVEEYPYIFKNGTSIPLSLSIQGRSYAAGTYGFNPRGSGSDVLLNDQTVSSVLTSANLNMSNSLNCVFGTGTNTPGVTVNFSCLTLMWRNLS